ncbi:MAG: ABC transporter permease subunit [Leptolyngbyaceae cyanobacterium RM2_2_4]|nr:ABC transporter permease subunit [Leptolyngbyaceae cyanobacterium RM2_2_4]
MAKSALPLGIGGGGAIALSLHQAGLFQRDWLNWGGLAQLRQFFQASTQPDLSPEFLHLTFDAAVITLAYAVCGTCLSLLFGLVGGVFASEVWWQSVFPRQTQQRLIWLTVRAVLAIPRAIHELIWGLFFLNIFGLDPLVAIVAIAIPYGAIVSKVFSEILDETPRQPLMALINSGVAPLSACSYSLFPQAFLDLLSYSFYRFECSIRSAAVLGIIGAGGLGYQILLSLQSLRYEQLWTLFYALFVLNGAVDFASAVLRHRLGSPSRVDLNLRRASRLNNRGLDKLRDGHPVCLSGQDAHFTKAAYLISARGQQRQSGDLWVMLAGVGALLLIPFCFWYVSADFSKLWSPRTMRLLTDIAQSSLPPNFDREQIAQLLALSWQTLAMSILAIAIAGIGGILLSFPAAHNFFLPGGLLNPVQSSPSGRLLAWGMLLLTRAFLLIARAVPAPIWALVALFVLFPGILPGAIALGLHNLGILGRLMAEVTENLDQRSLIALKAQGTPASLVFLYGVLPTTMARFLAYILYRWEVCMRETIIVGLVGAGGLGRLLTEQLSSFDYSSVIVTLSSFIVLTFVVDWISSRMRRSLR